MFTWQNYFLGALLATEVGEDFKSDHDVTTHFGVNLYILTNIGSLSKEYLKQHGLFENMVVYYSLNYLHDSDGPTIPISLGLSRFCLNIPNPDQYVIGMGKIPISTRVVIFS